MQYKRYGIVLIPEERINRLAIALSKQLLSFGSLFALKNRSIYPHLSLYHFDAERLTEKDSGSILTGLMGDLELTALRLHSYKSGLGEGFVDVEYEKDLALQSLQKMVIEAVESIQGTQRRPYDAVGASFRPHLTLGRLPQYNKVASDILSDIESFSGRFPSLGLFEIGQHGTCIKKLAPPL
jgi:2'-5' RNA ligase